MKNKVSLIQLLFLLLISNCASLPDSFQTGETSFEQNNYFAAEKSFENANQLKPESMEIENKLSITKYLLSKQLYTESKNRNEYDIIKKIDNLSQAKTRIERSISLSEKTYKKKEIDGLGIYEKMKKKLSADYKTENEQLFELLKAKRNEHKNITAALDQLNKQRDSVNLNTQTILNKSSKDPVLAFEEIKQFSAYAPFWLAVNERDMEIKNNAIKYYEKLGEKNITRGRLEAASKMYNKANQVIAGNPHSASGLESVEAKRNYNKKDYRKSFEHINRAVLINPESVFASRLQTKIKRTLYKSERRKAYKYSRHKAINKNIKAFNIYSFLTESVVEDDTLMIKEIRKKEAKLRTKIAKKLISKAKYLNKANQFRYSSVNLRLYQLANIFDPKVTKRNIKDAAFALAVSKQKQEFNILIYDKKYKRSQDLTDLNMSIAEELRKHLNSMKLPGINAVDPDTISKLTLKRSNILKDKPLPYKTSEVVLYSDIRKFDITELERDIPRQKSSKYISGQRWVHNPKYNVAYNNWQSAEQNYKNSYKLRQQALRSCNQIKEIFTNSLCKGAVSGISSSSRDSARNVLNNTPKQISENIISRYRYTMYTIKVKGSVVASITFFDKRNMNKAKSQVFEVLVNKEGHINEDVEMTDQNNIKNGNFNAPDLIAEKDNAKKQIINKVITAISEKVEQHYYNRFCIQGSKYLKKKKRAQAAESYSLCHTLALLVTTPVDQKLAMDAVNKYIGVNQGQAFKYGFKAEQPVVDNEEGKRAPASVEAEDAPRTLDKWPSSPAKLSSKTLKKINTFLSKH